MSHTASQCSNTEGKEIKANEDDPEPSETDNSLVNENNNCTLLSLLPNEVLLKIIQYLTPLDLLSLNNLGDQRLCELTNTLREANFSSCHRAHLEQISSYFSTDRVDLITKLSFNFMVHVLPLKLSCIICRCKNLSSLSLIGSGVKHDVLLNILEHCQKLEELAWDVSRVKKEISHTSMKSLFLFCRNRSFTDLADFVTQFPQLKYLFLNLASDFIIVHPLVGLGLNTYSLSSVKYGRRVIFTRNIWKVHQKKLSTAHRKIISRVLGDDIYLRNPSSNAERVLMCSPYLQIRSTEKDISLVLSDTAKAYSTVIIFLTVDFHEVYENLLKCVKEVTGDNLTNLSLELEETCYKYSNFLPMPLSPTVKVCNFLEEIFITCRNITVLNIATIHFPMGSPFKAICQLPNLRTLSVGSCAFFKSFDSEKHGDSWPIDRCQEFKNVVTCCPEIESFYLVCCKDDEEKVTENDVLPIKDWKRLKHLFLYSITFQSCSFLKEVADHCKQLKSFSLIEVAQNHACIFIDDIIYLLRTAKNLSFIRINETKFNPVYEGFWNAVGEAGNLEGICIWTRNQLYIDTESVINEIKKLKLLYLFHFYHPRACDSLYAGVKKSMQDNAVVNFKIERECGIPVREEEELKTCYHFQPYFSCTHIHPLVVTL